MNLQMENYKHWLQERGLDYPKYETLNHTRNLTHQLVFDHLPLSADEEALLGKILSAIKIDSAKTVQTLPANLASDLPIIYFSNQPTLKNQDLIQVPSLESIQKDPAQKRLAWDTLKSSIIQ